MRHHGLRRETAWRGRGAFFFSQAGVSRASCVGAAGEALAWPSSPRLDLRANLNGLSLSRSLKGCGGTEIPCAVRVGARTRLRPVLIKRAGWLRLASSSGRQHRRQRRRAKAAWTGTTSSDGTGAGRASVRDKLQRLGLSELISARQIGTIDILSYQATDAIDIFMSMDR